MRHRTPRRRASAVPSSRDRLPSLTGLRFWAALLVVAYHLSRQVGEIPGASELAWYGRSGVTFFFVLSGFVLAWTYDGRQVPAKVFLWRRFARIWPLLAATTMLSVGVWVALGMAVSTKAVAATLLLVNAWIPDQVILKGGNPAAWSLSDEAWFYLIFPMLMALPAVRTIRGRRWIWVMVCAGVVLVWLGGALIASGVPRVWALDYLPLTRTLQFLLGVVAGLAVARGWRPPIGLWSAISLAIGWHLVLIAWSRAVSDALWYGPYHASHLLSTPLFALLVAAAAHADLNGRKTGLGGKWAVHLGHWSFAWYLIHEIVIRVWVANHGRPKGLSDTAMVWLVVVAVSLALSACAYRWVEHPLERRLRGFGPRVPADGGRIGEERPAGETVRQN
ncbi:acyltransferase family protein [Streptomyces sp. WMMC940]|uniref:acyltransferase family protein n=1 Tax=Streptomyces sp. WMMC940 TaxID=3015153 RepID=UPI0022B63CF8|nr:acyltransferase [Streptomyces sp. WMMC940]MCZ7457364.1 acyltransferase [Streptomyces sp. WMMC940]